MINGHFISSTAGSIFICQYGEVIGDTAVLLLPSIFEELNLSRAIATKQALHLAEHNLPVFAVDYFGTGDSAGEINCVSWAIWQQNIIDTCKWLTAKQGITHVHLWGIRAGALFALNTLSQIQECKMSVSKLLLWKPVVKGKLFMSQFIRVKQASTMMQSTDKINWRKKIAEGERVEIAGYLVNEELVSSMESLSLPNELPKGVKVKWLELNSQKVTPAISHAVKDWKQEDYNIECIDCSAFWQTPEIFKCEELHQPSLAFLRER